jgi:redox-sensitive bicupin YhaK (pirin superfamily)
MMTLRPAAERGHFDHGWLDTYHTFSFASYHDPKHMGFRSLRVINDDRVQPGEGFGSHGHRDMEIITWVLEGALEHKDSMGNGSVIVPGDVQYMSAGTGVRHSEFNASKTDVTHFVQIWILPDREGYTPRYDQKRFEESEKLGRLRLVASPDGADGSIAIRQDVRLYASVLTPGQSVSLDLAAGRHAWIQVLRGKLSVNSQALSAGDGVAVSGEPRLDFTAGSEKTEFLTFDLA